MRNPVMWTCDIDGVEGIEEPTASARGATAISAQLPRGWEAFPRYGRENDHSGWIHACTGCAPLVARALADLTAGLRFVLHPEIDAGVERPEAPQTPEGWIAVQYASPAGGE